MKVKNIISSLLVFSSMTMHAQRIVCDDTCKLADAEPFKGNQRTMNMTAVRTVLVENVIYLLYFCKMYSAR